MAHLRGESPSVRRCEEGGDHLITTSVDSLQALLYVIESKRPFSPPRTGLVGRENRGLPAQHIEVRHAKGDEQYQSFAGDLERLELGEVIFADADNQAHARRRAHRQSALSAVREDTTAALIVAEAFHQTARTDVSTLLDVLALELESFRAAPAAKTFLSKISPSFEY